MVYFNPFFIHLAFSVVYILLVFFGGKILISVLTDYAIKPLISKSKKVKNEQRKQTISHAIHLLGNIFLYAFLALMVLRLLGISLASLITGAGITGLIFGLGAQSLIKDILAGIFILTEDQFDIGDIVKIGDIEGVVTHFTIRSTVVKNKAGHFCYIPHGNITAVTNRTKKK